MLVKVSHFLPLLEGNNSGYFLAKSFLNLQQIANRSRTSLKSTIELYTRTSLATKNLGYTAEQVNQFTETMNKAVMTSGATAQEANNALIQLSQGLSSGRLQGEELRSVLEQLPVVADIIARSMGVSRGELRKLGADGKITSQVIMEAFLKTTKRVDLMFEQTAMTVGQSWTILKNNLQTSIGEGSKSAMAELAKLLNDAASAVKDLTDSDGFSLLSGTLTALVKTMRTLFVLFESLGTVVLPIVASQIGRTVVRVAEIFANSLFPLIRIAQKIMPSSMGSGADALMNSVSGYFSKWRSGYDEWEDAAVKKSLTLNDRLAEIYAYKHPEAGYKPPEAGYKPPENQPTKKQTGESETAIRIRVIEGPALTREDPYGESVASLEELFSALKMTDKELEVHSQLMEFKKVLPSTEAYSYRLSTLVDQLKELDSVQSRQSALTAVDVARRAALVDQINALTYTINEMNKANERDLAIRKESLVFLQKENEAKGRRAKIQEDIRGQSTFGFRQTLSDLESVPGSKQGKSDFLVRQNTDLFEGTENAYDAQYREYERMVIKLDTLKEKEWISDESYSKARLNLWAKQNKAQLDGVGETFGNLAKLQESSSRRMAMIGKAAAQFQVAFNGVRAISEAWASGPFPANVPAITAATTAFAIQEAQLNNLAGFAYGGGFTVGGTGGIDSQTVAFRATPGEQVSITTPEQRKESAATAEYHYHDYAGSETKAERESKFAQFQRMAAATANDRSSARKQMELV
jgi:tape measure domain-containing protein